MHTDDASGESYTPHTEIILHDRLASGFAPVTGLSARAGPGLAIINCKPLMTNETAQGDDPAQNRGSDTQPGGGDAETRCVADGGYPQPEIGDRVTFIDTDGREHRAVVVDAVQDAEYISLVRSEQGQLGEDYTWSVDTETSVYPHYTEWASGAHKTHAFMLGWSE